MEKIDLVLREKLAELELLQNEMRLAVQDEQVMDYEFGAILNPIIQNFQNEIQYYFHLQSLTNSDTAEFFLVERL